MAHSLPLIEWDESSRAFRVNEDGARYVSQFEGKISVVIVAGRYRSGKSFLMNQLCGDAGGFGVGHTVESFTKGIWVRVPARGVAGVPTARTVDGEDVPVLLMDSEGLGATDKNVQHDTTVFSLASLLCSTLIFNGSGTIDEASITNLGFIANLTKHIRVRSATTGAAGSGGEGEDTLEDFNRFFPSFVWVLRDFLLALVDDDGAEITPDDYMEAALTEQPGFDKDTLARNRIRKCVKAFFRDRHCFTLVRPVDEEEQLQHLESVSPASLRAEFRAGMARVRSFLFENARAKELGGRFVNGAMLVQLARSYVGAINSGGIPSISDAWESASAAQAQRALQVAFDTYRARMTPPAKLSSGRGGADTNGSMEALPALPLDEQRLQAAHDAAFAAASKQFEGMLPSGAGAAAEKPRATLRAKAQEHLSDLQRNNTQASADACKALLRELAAAHVETVVASATETTDGISSDARVVSREAADVLDRLQMRASGDDAGIAEDELPGILDDLVARLDELPPLSVNSLGAGVWSAWSALQRAYTSRAVGPKASSTLAQEGMEVLMRAHSAVALACESAAAARQAAERAVAAVSRGVASDLLAQWQQTSGALAEASGALAAMTSQMADTQASLAAVRSEMAKLRLEHNSTLSSLQAAQEELKLNVGTLAAAAQREATLEKQLTDTRRTLMGVREELGTVTAAAAVTAARVAELERDSASTQSQLTSALDGQRDSGAEIGRLRGELAEARQALSVAALLKERMTVEAETLTQESKRQHSMIARLQDDVAAAQRRADVAGSQLTELTATRKREQLGSSEVHSELSRAKDALDALQVKYAASEETRAALEDRVVLMDAERTALQEELDARQQELTAVEEAMAELSQHVATLVTDAATTAAAHDAQVRAAEVQLKAVEDRRAALEIDLEAGQAVSDELEQELRAERAAHAAADAEVTALQGQLAASAAASKKLQAALDAMQGDSHEDKQRLAASMSGYQEQLREAALREHQLQDRITQLETALASSTAVADATASQLTSVEEELAAAHEHAAELDTTISELQAALEAERAAARKQQAEIDDRVRAVSTTSAAAGDLALRVQSLQSEMAALEHTLSVVQGEKMELATAVETSTALLVGKEAALAVSNSELAATRDLLLRAQAHEAQLGSSLDTTTAQLDELRSRAALAESELAGARAAEASLLHELDDLRTKCDMLTKSIDQLATQKRELEMRNTEVGAVGRHAHATVEGLRAAKAESERVIDHLSSELQQMLTARNAALANVAELTRKTQSLTEDVADWQSRHADATAAKDTALAALAAAHVEADAVRAKLREAQEKATADAAAVDADMTALRARVAAAEEESATARGARGALEKSLRAANADLAAARDRVGQLEAQLAEVNAVRDSARDSVDGVRNEIQVIASHATASLRKKDDVIKLLRAAQRDLQLKDRRRADVDASIETVRAGAEMNKYKQSGRRVTADARWVAVSSIASVAPGLPSSPGTSSRDVTVGLSSPSQAAESAYRGDVLCWREPGKKVFTKCVRFSEISQIVLGTESPVFRKFLEGHAASAPLDPACCFTVILKAGAHVIGEGGRVTPLPSGTTLDFEMKTAAETTAWVFGLRCLTLRAAGFGLYSLSRLTVKLQRIGLKVQALAAAAGVSPREYMARLRDAARRAVGASTGGPRGRAVVSVAGARGRAAAADPAARVTVAGTSRRGQSAAPTVSSPVSPTAGGQPRQRGAISAALRASRGEAAAARVTTPAPAPVVTSRTTRLDSDDDAPPVFAAAAAPVVQESHAPAPAPSVAPTAVYASGRTSLTAAAVALPSVAAAPPPAAAAKPSPTPAISPSVQAAQARTLDRTEGSGTGIRSSGAAAARASLFSGVKVTKGEYVPPGTYAAKRAREEEAAKAAQPEVQAAKMRAALGVDAPGESKVPASTPAAPPAAVPDADAARVRNFLNFVPTAPPPPAMPAPGDDEEDEAVPVAAPAPASVAAPAAAPPVIKPAAAAARLEDSDDDGPVMAAPARAAAPAPAPTPTPARAPMVSPPTRKPNVVTAAPPPPDSDDSDADDSSRYGLFAAATTAPSAASAMDEQSAGTAAVRRGSAVTSETSSRESSAAPTRRASAAARYLTVRQAIAANNGQPSKDDADDELDLPDMAAGPSAAAKALFAPKSKAPAAETRGSMLSFSSKKTMETPAVVHVPTVSAPVSAPAAAPVPARKPLDEMDALIADVEGAAEEVDRTTKTDYSFLLKQKAEEERLRKAGLLKDVFVPVADTIPDRLPDPLARHGDSDDSDNEVGVTRRSVVRGSLAPAPAPTSARASESADESHDEAPAAQGRRGLFGRLTGSKPPTAPAASAAPPPARAPVASDEDARANLFKPAAAAKPPAATPAPAKPSAPPAASAPRATGPPRSAAPPPDSDSDEDDRFGLFAKPKQAAAPAAAAAPAVAPSPSAGRSTPGIPRTRVSRFSSQGT